MTPDHQRADAAAATAVADMHGVVVQKAHDSNLAPGQRTLSRGVATAEPEITRRDVHTASSINAQRRFPKANSKDTNLAHQAAVRRSVVKGKSSARFIPTESSSTASSKPVLVHAPPAKVEMKKKTKTKAETDSPKPPPLESFSIQDILTSIGPEADASIDAIAEICGRSKLSLAEQHSSHRPPHVQHMITGSSPADTLPPMPLEPVVEVTSAGTLTRSTVGSLKLANAFHGGRMVSGDTTAAISTVTSQSHPKVSKNEQDEGSTDPGSTPLLSQIFAWLLRSTTGNEATSSSNRDAKVENMLRGMLSDADSLRSGSNVVRS